jgi:hypothetical protein
MTLVKAMSEFLGSYAKKMQKDEEKKTLKTVDGQIIQTPIHEL